MIFECNIIICIVSYKPFLYRYRDCMKSVLNPFSKHHCGKPINNMYYLVLGNGKKQRERGK